MNTEERHFTDMTKEEQEKSIHFDLKEIAHYLGGWDELRQLVTQLEDNANEAAYKLNCNSY